MKIKSERFDNENEAKDLTSTTNNGNIESVETKLPFSDPNEAENCDLSSSKTEASIEDVLITLLKSELFDNEDETKDSNSLEVTTDDIPQIQTETLISKEPKDDIVCQTEMETGTMSDSKPLISCVKRDPELSEPQHGAETNGFPELNTGCFREHVNVHAFIRRIIFFGYFRNIEIF